MRCAWKTGELGTRPPVLCHAFSVEDLLGGSAPRVAVAWLRRAPLTPGFALLLRCSKRDVLGEPVQPRLQSTVAVHL